MKKLLFGERGKAKNALLFFLARAESRYRKDSIVGAVPRRSSDFCVFTKKWKTIMRKTS